MATAQQPPDTTIDTIIHIGAGRCSELPQYLAANPARIVLIEPQPDRATALRDRTSGSDNIEVIEAAVAAPDAGDQLKVFNQSDYSSLREPTGLREIFPGLRTKREFDVDRITPGELVEREGVEPGQSHWLILDAPGEESAILEALTASEKITAFARIDLHCGTTSHYEGSEPASSLLQKLADNGYEVEANDAESDPDRPHWAQRRNALKLENQVLQERLATRDEELTKAQRDAQETREQLEARTRERDEARQAHEEAKQEAEQRRKERDEHKQAAEQAQAQVERLQAERDEHRQRLKELQDQEREWSKKVDEATAERAERERQKTQLNEELTRAEGQIDLIKDLLLRNEL